MLRTLAVALLATAMSDGLADAKGQSPSRKPCHIVKRSNRQRITVPAARQKRCARRACGVTTSQVLAGRKRIQHKGASCHQACAHKLLTRLLHGGSLAEWAKLYPFRTEAVAMIEWCEGVRLPFPGRLSTGGDVNSPMMSRNQSIFRTATSVCP